MRYDSHIISSVVLGTALTHYSSIEPSVSLFAGIVIGSLLPDIDEDESYVGKRSLGTAKVVKGIFGHRGFTHSLLATIIVFIPSLFFHYSFYSALLGLGFGYLFHILEDMLSKSGVPLFWFFSESTTELRIKIPLYTTNHFSELIVVALFVLGFAYMMQPFVITHETLFKEIGVICLFYGLGKPLAKLKIPVFHALFRNKLRRRVMLGMCTLLLFYISKSYLPLM